MDEHVYENCYTNCEAEAEGKPTLLRVFYFILQEMVDKVLEQCGDVTDWGRGKVIWLLSIDCWMKSKHINMDSKDPPSCFTPTPGIYLYHLCFGHTE